MSTIQFPKPLRVNLHQDMKPPRVKLECGDIVVADCIDNPDHAERIAACVNACAGIADPHAAIQVMRELRDALADWRCLWRDRLTATSGMTFAIGYPIATKTQQLLTKAKEVLP